MNGFFRPLPMTLLLLACCMAGCEQKNETSTDENPSPFDAAVQPDGPSTDTATDDKEPGQTPATEEKTPEVPVITADEIFTLYSENTPKADELYQGKILRVTALVEDPFLERIIGTPGLMIGTADKTLGVAPQLECLMAPDKESSLDGLWRRQQITIEGQCRDYVKGVVVFANCRIIETGPAIEITDATAEGLLAELADNEPAFLKSYVDTVLQVEGIVAAIDTERRRILIRGTTQPPGRPHYLRIDFLPSEINMMQQFQSGTSIRVKGECGDMDADGNIPLFHARVIYH